MCPRPPGEQCEAVSQSLRQNLGARDARQVEVAREVVDEQLYRHTVAAPERDLVEMLAQDRRPS
jgi:hypothetical protein